MSTARLGMALCSDTVSMEVIFASLTVLSQAAALFIFSAAQVIVWKKGGSVLFGTRDHPLTLYLGMWNLLFPLFIAAHFLGIVTENVNLS